MHDKFHKEFTTLRNKFSCIKTFLFKTDLRYNQRVLLQPVNKAISNDD